MRNIIEKREKEIEKERRMRELRKRQRMSGGEEKM